MNHISSDLSPSAPLIAIARHRIGTDGVGITTLIAFHGCGLRCRYCLNPQCHLKQGIWKRYTTEALYEEVRKDELYFLATGGGLTFGGGEPLLHADFIHRFCQQLEDKWHITLETSLYAPTTQLKKVLPYVDEWIVDVKDMNADIYHAYTGCSNQRLYRNLKVLAAHGKAETCLIRIPRIPNFNTVSDTHRSKKLLKEMGFTRFNHFTYNTDISSI